MLWLSFSVICGGCSSVFIVIIFCYLYFVVFVPVFYGNPSLLFVVVVQVCFGNHLLLFVVVVLVCLP